MLSKKKFSMQNDTVNGDKNTDKENQNQQIDRERMYLSGNSSQKQSSSFVKSKTPRLRIGGQKVLPDSIDLGGQSLEECKKQRLNTARSANKDDKSPKQSLSFVQHKNDYCERLQKSYSSRSALKSQDSSGSKEVKHQFKPKHIKGAKSTPLHNACAQKVTEQSRDKAKATSQVRNGLNKTIQPRQQSRSKIGKKPEVQRPQRPQTQTKLTKSRSPTKLSQNPESQKEEFLSCLGTSDIMQSSKRRSILTESKNLVNSGSQYHRSCCQVNERKSCKILLQQKQGSLLIPSNKKGMNSAASAYYTAQESIEDEDLQCDEELAISDELNHTETQGIACKISKMEYESSSKKYKPELDIIQTLEDEEDNAVLSHRRKNSQASKYATFGVTTASSKFEHQFTSNALLHQKTSDFSAFPSLKSKKQKQNAKSQESDASDKTDVEDFTYENEATLFFDEQATIEAALLSQRSSANKTGTNKTPQTIPHVANKASPSGIIKKASPPQLHQCQQVQSVYSGQFNLKDNGSLLKSNCTLRKQYSPTTARTFRQSLRNSIPQSQRSYLNHTQSSRLILKKIKTNSISQSLGKHISFNQVPQKDFSFTNSVIMPTQSPESVRSCKSIRRDGDEEQTLSYEMAKQMINRDYKANLFDFQTKSFSPYQGDSPFRRLCQHDMSQEELISDSEVIESLSDFDAIKHSADQLNLLAQEISQVQICNDFNHTMQTSSQSSSQQVLIQPDLHRMHLIQTIQSLVYLNMLPAEQIEQAESTLLKVDLPKPFLLEQTKTLLFDLDETLAHCTANDSPMIQSSNARQVWIPMETVNDHGKLCIDDIPVIMNLRPFIQECLQTCAQKYQIGVFTASSQDYADAVIDMIDPTRSLIQFRLYRQHCYQTHDGHYIKDLRVIRNRDLKDVLLVDNSVHSFGFQLDNGVPIIPFYSDEKDQELIHLASYVLSRAHHDDVRPQNAATFQLKELQQADLQSALIQFQKEDANLSRIEAFEPQNINCDLEESKQCQCCQPEQQFQNFTQQKRNQPEQRNKHFYRNETINEESFEESIASESGSPARVVCTEVEEKTEMIASEWEHANVSRADELEEVNNLRKVKIISGHGYSKSSDYQFNPNKQLSHDSVKIMSQFSVKHKSGNSLRDSTSDSELDQEAIKALAKRLDFIQIDQQKQDQCTFKFDSRTELAVSFLQSAVNDVVIVKQNAQSCSYVQQDSSSGCSNISSCKDNTPVGACFKQLTQ